MCYLGIDYGSKKIGLAVSDEEGKFAFPVAVLKNNKDVVGKIKKIIKEKGVERVVIGLPLMLNNQPTADTEPAKKFKENLENFLGRRMSKEIPVFFEKEFFTTKEAERIQGKHKKIDASAAALILKNYLSKQS